MMVISTKERKKVGKRECLGGEGMAAVVMGQSEKASLRRGCLCKDLKEGAP